MTDACPAEERVRAAMSTLRRADFLPPGQRANADLDRALPIGFGQTNSQPRTVLQLLTLLDVRAGQRVLDVGSGSAWTTALLGTLTGPHGRVLGVEVVPELVEWGAQNLRAAAMPWTSVREATPGELGLPADAPFDRILVSAAADELPQSLVHQLGDDALLVIPVCGRLVCARRDRSGDVTMTRHGHYQFVPLRS